MVLFALENADSHRQDLIVADVLRPHAVVAPDHIAPGPDLYDAVQHQRSVAAPVERYIVELKSAGAGLKADRIGLLVQERHHADALDVMDYEAVPLQGFFD